MHCPDCSTLLSRTGEGSEACARCGGDWVEPQALPSWLREGEGTPPRPGAGGAPSGPPPHRRCPICRAVLRERRFPASLPPIRLFACPLGHGDWLPTGTAPLLREAARRAAELVRSRAAYFELLARAAACTFRRSTRSPLLRRRRGSALARLFS